MPLLTSVESAQNHPFSSADSYGPSDWGEVDTPIDSKSKQVIQVQVQGHGDVHDVPS